MFAMFSDDARLDIRKDYTAPSMISLPEHKYLLHRHNPESLAKCISTNPKPQVHSMIALHRPQKNDISCKSPFILGKAHRTTQINIAFNR
jgi:hypothetical protein